ncbi:MAG: CBS domain-containing protein [Veillonella sp.]|nr:CBS domain-containing protein [Veillonella sp.]
MKEEACGSPLFLNGNLGYNTNRDERGLPCETVETTRTNCCPNVGYYYVGLSKETQTAERLKSFLVSDVLSQAVVVNGDTSLYDTIVTLFTEDVGTILVCDGSYLVGVVSRKDLLRASMGQTDSHTMPISMIMTPVSKVIAVEPTDTLVEAAQKMIDYEVDCLPVVAREDIGNKKRLKVVGRVSKTTVAKVFLECSTH